MEDNLEIRNFLKNSIQTERVSHAYLFLGEKGMGKKEVALWYEQLLNGGISRLRANLLFVEPEEAKKVITVDQIRDVRKRLRLTPQGKYKVVVFSPAEAINQTAQNALLKTLEEPSSRVVLILLANSLQGLVETLLSRCQILKFHVVSDKEAENWLKKEGLSKQEIQKIIFLGQGKIEKIKFWKNHLGKIEQELKNLEKVQELFDGGLEQQLSWVEKIKQGFDLDQTLASALQIYHYLLLEKTGVKTKEGVSFLKENVYPQGKLFHLLKNIQKTKTFLKETYVNKKLALNQLFINL